MTTYLLVFIFFFNGEMSFERSIYIGEYSVGVSECERLQYQKGFTDFDPKDGKQVTFCVQIRELKV